EVNRQERQKEYESWCKDFTDDDRERIKRACDLLAKLFDTTDRDEVESVHDEFEAEYDALDWSHRKAVEYFRAECLVKKYKDKSCFTNKKTRDWYRLQAERVRGRF